MITTYTDDLAKFALSFCSLLEFCGGSCMLSLLKWTFVRGFFCWIVISDEALACLGRMVLRRCQLALWMLGGYLLALEWVICDG